MVLGFTFEVWVAFALQRIQVLVAFGLSMLSPWPPCCVDIGRVHFSCHSCWIQIWTPGWQLTRAHFWAHLGQQFQVWLVLSCNLTERCIESPVVVLCIFRIINWNLLPVDLVGALGHTERSVDLVDRLFSNSFSILHDEIEKRWFIRLAMLFLDLVQFPQNGVPDEKVLFVAPIWRIFFAKGIDCQFHQDS